MMRILEGQSKAYPPTRSELIADPTADDREDSPNLPGVTSSTAESPPTLDAFALPLQRISTSSQALKHSISIRAKIV
jgi:hypothetical protein